MLNTIIVRNSIVFHTNLVDVFMTAEIPNVIPVFCHEGLKHYH
jgi:hypothetical protein